MIQICPCCKKEFHPPVAADSGEGDMGSLFSCNHCQSVLKWDNKSLQIVYESKEEPSSVALDEKEISSLEPEEGVLPEMRTKEETVNGSEVIQVEVLQGQPQQEIQEGPAQEEPLQGESSQEDVQAEWPEKAQEESQKEEQQNENVDEEINVNEEIQENSANEGANVSVFSTEGEKSLESPSDEFSDDHFSGEEAMQTDPSEQDFSDVEQYGNAQASSEKGFLRYDLRISGLDSNEIEKQVLDILEDSRFNWDANEVLRSQKEGVLVIKNLNPIKAMCLVSDLSFLSVEISWEQYMALNVGTQEKAEPAEQKQE